MDDKCNDGNLMLVSEHIVGLTDIGLCSLRIHTFQLLWIWSWLYHCDCWAALSTWVTIKSSKKLMVRLCEGVSRRGKSHFAYGSWSPMDQGLVQMKKDKEKTGWVLACPSSAFWFAGMETEVLTLPSLPWWELNQITVSFLSCLCEGFWLESYKPTQHSPWYGQSGKTAYKKVEPSLCREHR